MLPDPDRRPLTTTFGDAALGAAVFLIGLLIIFYAAWPELREMIFAWAP